MQRQSAAVFDDFIHQRNKRLCAFDPETLGANERAGEVLFKLLCDHQLEHQRVRLIFIQRRLIQDRLHLRDQPVALRLIGDVDERH